MTRGLVLAFFRYSLTGLLAACLDLSLYALLLTRMGVWYVYAHTLSRAVGGATGFVLNRRWTFGWSGRAELPSHLVKFAITYLFSYAASSWLLYLFVEHFRLPAIPAKMVAEGTVFCFNFLSLRHWAFQHGPNFRPFQQIGSLLPWAIAKEDGGRLADDRHA